MKTNGKRTAAPMRWSRGRRYVDYDKQDLAILTAARRWLNSHGLRRTELTDAERRRRVAIYAAQVERDGQISEWLPPPDERGIKRRRMPVRLQQWSGFAY